MNVSHHRITCLAEQHLATAAHRGAVFFPSGRAASARLAALTEMEVLDRSRVPGRTSYRYTLGWAGAAVYALRNGKTPPTRRAVAWQGQQALFSAHRTHKEGVLTFFALLHLAARPAGNAEVTEWMSESAAAAEIINARPDGAGTVTWRDGRRLRFWYEHDMGTETIGRLTEVIQRYRNGRLPREFGDRVLLIDCWAKSGSATSPRRPTTSAISLSLWPCTRSCRRARALGPISRICSRGRAGTGWSMDLPVSGTSRQSGQRVEPHPECGILFDPL